MGNASLIQGNCLNKKNRRSPCPKPLSNHFKKHLIESRSEQILCSN